jgi:hypothetical protein
MKTNVPLDTLSALVMLSSANEEDLCTVYGAVGALFASGPMALPERRSMPASVNRTMCMKHLLAVFARKVYFNLDQEADWLQAMLIRDAFADMVRDGSMKVFAVRRPSTKTWHECRHCRAENRKRERLCQSYG